MTPFFFLQYSYSWTRLSWHTSGHLRQQNPSYHQCLGLVHIRRRRFYSILLNNLSEEQFLELLGKVFIPKSPSFSVLDQSVYWMPASHGTSCHHLCFNTLKQMEYSFKVLRWPPKSSQLSPFDKIWSKIEGTIRLQRTQPKNAQAKPI